MSKPNVLVVDDEEGITDMVSEFLKYNFDVNVFVQNHSNDVMSLIETNSVDVLIQDIDVPGPNGFQVVKQIRKTGKHVIIFLISGWVEEEYCLRSEDLGANFMTKPIGFRILRNRLTDIFEENGFDYKKK